MVSPEDGDAVTKYDVFKINGIITRRDGLNEKYNKRNLWWIEY